MKAEIEAEADGQRRRELKVEGLQLDLGSFRSTRACADAFKAKNLPLHILINNAGVLADDFCELYTKINNSINYTFLLSAKTENGHEIMYQVYFAKVQMVLK